MAEVAEAAVPDAPSASPASTTLRPSAEASTAFKPASHELRSGSEAASRSNTLPLRVCSEKQLGAFACESEINLKLLVPLPERVREQGEAEDEQRRKQRE